MINRKGIIEAVLFASGDGVEISKLCEIADTSESGVEDLAAEMQIDYANRGLKLIRTGDKFQLATREEYAEYVQKIVAPKILKPLSEAAVEVLTVIAYKQPVTRQVIEKIRGVECKFSIIKLLERDLIEEIGRLDAPGRPVLYGTTDYFLKTFGFSSLNELPELADFQLEALDVEDSIDYQGSEENANYHFNY